MANITHHSRPVPDGDDVVLITHADCDVGYWQARELLTSGCRVVVTARQVTSLTRILLGENGSQVIAVAADIDDAAQRAQLVERAQARLGRITWVLDGHTGSLTAACANTTDYRRPQRRTRAAVGARAVCAPK